MTTFQLASVRKLRPRGVHVDAMHLITIGLIVLAGLAASGCTPAVPPSGTAGEVTPVAGAAELGTPERVSVSGVVEPSGVTVDPQSGHLFVVGDEGSIAELDADQAVMRSQPMAPDVEDVALHTPTGQLVTVMEDTSELMVLDPETLTEVRRFPLDRAALLDTEPTGEPNEGFEGLAFRADASVPGGGVWYLTHQRLPAMVVELTFDPSAEAHPIGAESVVARWEIPGTDEVNGITYVATLNRLLVVGDRQDTLVVLGLGGQPLAQLDLPGDQQEGVAVDADGTLWIADDEGGSLLAFRDAVAVIEGALADAP